MAASPLLAIAHFCETHGPTPLMVTQVQSVPCFICIECYSNDDEIEERPRTRKDSGKDMDKFKNVAQITTTLLNTDLEKSPEKQKSSIQDVQAASRRRDSSFRKTYNEDDKKQASQCGSCALTVPSHLKGKLPSGAPGSPGQNEGSPYLRTRRPVQRVLTPPEDPPSSSSSTSSSPSTISDPSDSDASDTQITREDTDDSSSTIQQIAFSNTASSSPRKETSSSSNVHNHYLDYTSTHTPLASPTYTLLRNCCLRTLSTETLPPSSTVLPPSSPISNHLNNHSFHGTSSGGPIFFGDPLAGYTTAYIFRIPDPFARGRIRRYALMALDTSGGQRRAMRAFSFLASQFKELASWILGLAEREAERLEGGSTLNTTLNTATTSNNNSNENSPGGLESEPPKSKTKSLVSYPTPLSPLLPLDTKFAPSGSGEGSGKFKQTSSFLSGRTYDPDGGPYSRKGGYNVVRARGLAELVGMEDFFLELHRRFVVLLAQM